MFNHATKAIDFFDKLDDLVKDQSKWSQATFGADSERGPIGPLKHLAMEAIEASENPADISEYADCFLLLLDAARRAGWKLSHLIDAAQKKMEVNKSREYLKPIDSISPVEHIR